MADNRVKQMVIASAVMTEDEAKALQENIAELVREFSGTYCVSLSTAQEFRDAFQPRRHAPKKRWRWGG